MRCAIFTLLLLVLASCVPAQDAFGGAVNEALGDEAQLEPAPQSLVYVPAGRSDRTVIDVRGEGLESTDPEDNCSGDAAHLSCALGTVTRAVVLEMTGRDVSGVVSYQRAGRWYLEVLVVP